MGKLLKALFPGPEAAGGVVKTAAKVIDEAFYTSQEKAEDAQKAKQALADNYIKWLEATSGQNRSRRAIALTVTFIWAFMLMMGFLVDIIIAWAPESIYDQLRASADSILKRSEEIHTPFMIVLGFYFGSRMLGALKGNGKASS